MQAQYKTYDSYKDSGEAWIGRVPEHWESIKLKHLFYEKKHSPNISLGCGSISFGEVVEKDDERVTEATKASYQEVLEGEFLINPLNLNYDLKSLRIALSKINVVVSAGYLVIKEKAKINKNYFKYLLHRFDVDHMKLMGSGVRQTINFGHIANSLLINPPLDEQSSIADFLDQKTAEIDAAIEKKQRLIELLKEQKSILINQAVTKGLNRNAPMKDSGIEWIGQIPAHWEVKKLKYIGKAIIGLTYDPSNLCSAEEGTLVLRSSNLGDGKFQYGEDLNAYVKSAIPDKLTIKPKDILICSRNGSRDLIGKCALATINDQGHSFGAFTTVFRSSINQYLFQILNSEIFKHLSGSFLTSTINQLTIGNLNSICVPLPPLEEQENIRTFLEQRRAEFDVAVSAQKIQIEKLNEFKQTLIAHAVTGKIKI